MRTIRATTTAADRKVTSRAPPGASSQASMATSSRTPPTRVTTRGDQNTEGCTTKALEPKTVVLEAELKLTGTGPVWEQIVIVH